MLNDFNEILEGRKSVKGFDPDYKISHEEMNEMIAKATKAPSSVNMQPWRFVVVESDEAKAKLRPLIQFNTNQNDTSSAMIVIFGDLQCYEEGEYIYEQAVVNGHMPQEVKEQMLPIVLENYKNRTRQSMNDIVKVDSSLAAMQLMLVAKQHGYDTNPIGGFEHEEIGKAFGYDLERYVPVMIVAIGKKAKKAHTSFRMPVDRVIDYK